MSRGQPSVRLRRATAADADAVWRWRNDPVTRDASLDSAEIPWAVHQRWFDESLQRPDRELYIVAADGKDAGMVRLDIRNGEGVVSVNIAPESRRRGLGTAALQKLVQRTQRRPDLGRLVAEIKASNIASRTAFRRAGFSESDSRNDGAEALVRLAIPARRRDGRRLCIIPARGGSKRFPGKNVALFDGTPLLTRTVEVARESSMFDRILVSTDDPEAERLAQKAEAEVHHRAAELADDSARLVDVCLTILDELATAGDQVEAFCLLIPTSPFRTAAHVRESYDLLQQQRANGVMSVAVFPHVAFWAVHEVKGYVRLFWGKRWLRSRHELPSLYRHNGVVLWMRTAAFRRYRDFYCPKVVPYHMSLDESVDIDYPLDLDLAEVLQQRRRS
jgi:CMP-N-acetylneuraminic acid synthetase/RimJ/RimL family protein N-acetyltransferase